MADRLRAWALNCIRPILKRREQYTDEEFEHLLVQTFLGAYDAGKAEGISMERLRMLEIMDNYTE